MRHSGSESLLITNKLSAGMLHHPKLGCTQKEFDRSECNSSKNLRTCIPNDQIKISSNLIVKCIQPWADCCHMRVWHQPKSGKFTSPLFISIYSSSQKDEVWQILLQAPGFRHTAGDYFYLQKPQSAYRNYQLPITNYPLPITHYQLPITRHTSSFWERLYI